MLEYYDVKRKTSTPDGDGGFTNAWTVVETREIDVQAVRFSAERSATIATIQVGGQIIIPSYRGWISSESDATATDRITPDSGTTDLLVLRTYDFEDHKEMDLKEVDDD